MIKLLDCTLRDGGYINNWEFGNITIKSVVSRLDCAGVDYIECGFLDSRNKYDENRTVFPTINSIDKCLGECLPQNSKLVAMIDYGTFEEELLIPQSESSIYGIRLIFQKEKAKEALAFASKIKEQGYKLSLNLVATFTYSPLELLELVEQINEVNPEAVSIVDTYGIMFEDDMIKYASLLDSSLLPNISLGFHSHNNTNFSDANCISFIKQGFKRNLIIDGSILGMGKNSGNAHTEVLAMYLAKNKLRELECGYILECAVTDIQRFLTKQEWGYNINNLVSAICECSPNWVKYYTKMGTLTISDIVEILNSLPKDERKLVSFFSEEKAYNIYTQYCERQKINDSTNYAKLRERIGNKDVLILCPGKSIMTHREIIEPYLFNEKVYSIAVNFISETLKTNGLYIGSNRRYSQISAFYGTMQYHLDILSSSNVLFNHNLKPNYVFSFSELNSETGTDNSGILLMQIIANIGARKILVAGFDGYEAGEDNYFLKDVSLGNAYADNEIIKRKLSEFFSNNNVKIEWLTPSKLVQS